MDSNLPFIYVDPVLVEQAFVQIVDNAAKYSPNGSTITVAAKRNGHGVVLSVNDTGAGLTDEEKRAARRAVLPRRRATPPPLPARASGCGSPRPSSAPTAARSRPTAPGVDQGTMMSINLPLAPNAPQPEAGPDG